jgi:hypothetical protein
MLSALNKSLILVLAMLQLFAPLVHAHTGNNGFNQGIHIPGLESFHQNHDALVSQNVNLDKDSDGLLVMVDMGIKNPLAMIVEGADNSFTVLPPDQLRINPLPKSDSNFSPQTKALASRRLSPSQSPRAPPAQ